MFPFPIIFNVLILVPYSCLLYLKFKSQKSNHDDINVHQENCQDEADAEQVICGQSDENFEKNANNTRVPDYKPAKGQTDYEAKHNLPILYDDQHYQERSLKKQVKVVNEVHPTQETPQDSDSQNRQSQITSQKSEIQQGSMENKINFKMYERLILMIAIIIFFQGAISRIYVDIYLVPAVFPDLLVLILLNIILSQGIFQAMEFGFKLAKNKGVLSESITIGLMILYFTVFSTLVYIGYGDYMYFDNIATIITSLFSLAARAIVEQVHKNTEFGFIYYFIN